MSEYQEKVRDALIDHILNSRRWMQALFIATATLAITAMVPYLNYKEDIDRRSELMGILGGYKVF